MPTIQEQYTEFAQRGQEATFAIVDAWTQSVQNLSTRVPTAMNQDAALQVIDQTFDFFGKVLDVQRNAAKQFVSTSATVAEDVVQRATTAVNEASAATAKAASKK
jgi:hypothetical protein